MRKFQDYENHCVVEPLASYWYRCFIIGCFHTKVRQLFAGEGNWTIKFLPILLFYQFLYIMSSQHSIGKIKLAGVASTACVLGVFLPFLPAVDMNISALSLCCLCVQSHNIECICSFAAYQTPTPNLVLFFHFWGKFSQLIKRISRFFPDFISNIQLDWDDLRIMLLGHSVKICRTA